MYGEDEVGRSHFSSYVAPHFGLSVLTTHNLLVFI